MTGQHEPRDASIHGRVDFDGRLISADPPLAELHLRAGGEAGGMLAVPQLAALARLARRFGTPITRPLIAADGDLDLDLEVHAEPGEGHVDLVISAWTPRPARSHAPASTLEREADFVRAAADWMWETDDKLRFTGISSAAAEAIDAKVDDLLGEPLTRLFHFVEEEDGALPILSALAEQRRFDDQKVQLRGGNGALYGLAAIPLRDGQGRFAGFRGAAAQFEAAEVLEWPVRAPRISHAFGERLEKALRDPIHHIIAHADSIGAQNDGPLRADYAGYAQDIGTAGRHLLGLVDDLVDLQAIERPDFAIAAEPIDLAQVARHAAALLSGPAASRAVRIEQPGDDTALPACGEPRRALQVMVNLLSNAIRYSPDGGTVTIDAACDDSRTWVVVADRGKGIAPADQARIFEKFERVDASEAGGTGLGLYIARRLARAMGGDITCHSVPGEGARFTFILPLRV